MNRRFLTLSQYLDPDSTELGLMGKNEGDLSSAVNTETLIDYDDGDDDDIKYEHVRLHTNSFVSSIYRIKLTN